MRVAVANPDNTERKLGPWEREARERRGARGRRPRWPLARIMPAVALARTRAQRRLGGRSSQDHRPVGGWRAHERGPGHAGRGTGGPLLTANSSKTSLTSWPV